MSDPKCPYCGNEMRFHRETIFGGNPIEKVVRGWFRCRECLACSPSVAESIHIGEEMMIVEKVREKAREKAHDSVDPKNRVLTFDEVATFADLPEMTLMWVEVKFTKESDIFQEIPIGFNGELMQFLEVNSASLYTHKQNYPPEDYGSRWRCWLEKPTVKEMEMALWEE